MKTVALKVHKTLKVELFNVDSQILNLENKKELTDTEKCVLKIFNLKREALIKQIKQIEGA